MKLECWVVESAATCGVAGFLSLGDVCRLRCVSKAAAALADAWLPYLQLHIELMDQLKSKGKDPDENGGFLEALDFATSRGAAIRCLDIYTSGQPTIVVERLMDGLLARVAVAGRADRSLLSLSAAKPRPSFSVLHSDSALRCLDLDLIQPDAVFPSRCLLAAFKGSQLRELRFRPAAFGFSAADLDEIPSGLTKLQLSYSIDEGLDLVELEAWVALAQPRPACTHLSIYGCNEVVDLRSVSLPRLDEVFPSLDELIFHKLVPHSPGTLFKFPFLRCLVLDSTVVSLGYSDQEPPDLSYYVNSAAGTGEELIASALAFHDCPLLRFDELRVVNYTDL